jgi:Gas vesicle synthesis protein GvpL/GvpF
VSGLEEWARARAPELLKRAEEEAVAELRRALVEAAMSARSVKAGPERPAAGPERPPLAAERSPTAERSRPVGEPSAPTPERSSSGPKRSPSGHALWAYCIAPAGHEPPEGLAGVDSEGAVERIVHGDLATLVSRVPLAEFGEEPLRENLNELDWLERVARAHEHVLEDALARTPIIPLRLCTIYSDAESVTAMLERESDQLLETLDRLEGRQEWGVKLLVDRDALASAARARSEDVASLEQELAGRSGGGAYMVSRKLDRRVAEVTTQLAAELADEVHARLGDWASDSVLNSPQNRDLSGHEGEMLLNAAYLVDAGRTDELCELLAELEHRHRDLGARLELTGPWPPYNFVSRLASPA